jgi:hypothetical protein
MLMLKLAKRGLPLSPLGGGSGGFWIWIRAECDPVGSDAVFSV